MCMYIYIHKCEYLHICMCIFIYRERVHVYVYTYLYMYNIYERVAWPGPPAGTGPGIARLRESFHLSMVIKGVFRGRSPTTMWILGNSWCLISGKLTVSY